MTTIARTRRRFSVVSRTLLAATFGLALTSGCTQSDANPDPMPEPTTSASPMTTHVTYGTVRVTIPGSWSEVEQDRCDTARLGQWSRDPESCESDEAVTFYDPALLEPVNNGPGITGALGTDTPWHGHVLSGDVGVYATSSDRAVVRRILASVERLD